MSTYRVAVRFSIQQEEAINVWHYEGGDSDRTDWSDALGHFYTNAKTDTPRGCKTLINALVRLEDITFAKLGDEGPPLLVQAGIDCAGTGSANPLGCSIVLSLRTETAGRSGRGRIYLPPFSSSLVENATFGPWLGSTPATDLEHATKDLIEANDQMAVYSPKNDDSHLVNAIFFRRTFGYQRRRQNALQSPYVTVLRGS